MKIDARRLEGFLGDPRECRGVLLYGADAGLVRERSQRLMVAVAGSLDDPFRVAVLGREAAGGVLGELSAGALSGGRRVVHLADAADGVAAPIRLALGRPWTSFLLVETGELAPRSKLRLLFESERELGAVACYPMEVGEIGARVGAGLRELGIRIDADALGWLAARLPPERGVLDSEVRRLALFVHPASAVGFADVQLCFGQDGGAAAGEAMLLAATSGDLAATEACLSGALAEGASPVGLLVGAIGHVHRLHRARLLAAGGVSLADAMKALRPPVFFRSQSAFLRSLALWSVQACIEAAARLSAAELACKRTGAPAEQLARAALMGLAMTARRQLR